MATSIERYKYCEQVKDNILDRLAKTRNKYLALKEEAKPVVASLRKKLKWSEDSWFSLRRSLTGRLIWRI